MSSFRAFATVLLALAAAGSPAWAAPPAAPVRDVVETHHGVEVHDPYRDLEDQKKPATQAWLKAQGDYAGQVLAGIAGRDDMAQRIANLRRDAGEVIYDVTRVRGERLFYMKRAQGGTQFKLMVRDGLRGRERVLVDPEALARSTGVPHAVNYMVPSWDGRHVAYGLSAGGSEDTSLHVMDVARGKERMAPVPRVREGQLHWTPDDRALAYNQLRDLAPDAAETETYLDSTVFLLQVGDDAAKARPLFGPLVQRDLGLQRLDVATVAFQPGSRFMVARTTDTTVPEGRIYVAPLADLARPAARWKQLVSPEDGVTDLRVIGDKLYLRTHVGAPRGRWLVLDLARGETLAQARTAVAEPAVGVLRGLVPLRGSLLAEVSQGFTQRLLRVDAKGVATEDVAPSLEGSTYPVFDTEGAHADLWLQTSQWTAPPRIWRSTGPMAKPQDTGLLTTALPRGVPGMVATEVLVTSHDGVKVPLAIVHRADLKKDGERPTLLEGYASYGLSIEAGYSQRALAWLERGGVLAYVNARGSGAYGDAWHRAGFKTTKPNTWKDGIAAAKYLIDSGYTRPDKLGISGTSAGGIFVGRAVTEAPQLFAAAIFNVGSLDTVRAESTANGITNISEFGTVKDAVEFKALLEMSTYHQVKDGVAYPGVLLIHGLNDPRVEVWNSAKTAARLQAARPDGKPVLLRVDPQAGHGIGSTATQIDWQVADMYSFLLWQFGLVKGPELR